MHDEMVTALERVGRATPETFDSAATQAARLGRVAIPGLMLIARDGSALLGRACAVVALSRVADPTATIALTRIAALPTGHARVSQLAEVSRRTLAATWSPEAVRAYFDASSGGDPILDDYEDPWDAAEFPGGYGAEMDRITREFGDPEWYEEPGRSRSPYQKGNLL